MIQKFFARKNVFLAKSFLKDLFFPKPHFSRPNKNLEFFCFQKTIFKGFFSQPPIFHDEKYNFGKKFFLRGGFPKTLFFTTKIFEGKNVFLRGFFPKTLFFTTKKCFFAKNKTVLGTSQLPQKYSHLGPRILTIGSWSGPQPSRVCCVFDFKKKG